MEMLINGNNVGWLAGAEPRDSRALYQHRARASLRCHAAVQGLEMSKRLPDHDDVDYCLKDWEAALAEDVPQGVNPEMRFIVKARKQRELEQEAEQAEQDKTNIYFGVDQSATLMEDPDGDYGCHAVINV
jgi:hypothetical protein